jgi:hypothetical protein
MNWSAEVTLAVIGILGFLVMLWIVLSAARRLRPGSFRLKATMTKWVSLDLEMRSTHDLGVSAAPDTPARGDATQSPGDRVDRCMPR